MINSMTGYGSYDCENDKISFSMELKSVNSKYYESNLKLPYIFSHQEEKINNIIQKWTVILFIIGFAPTKALAKVANRICKKFDKKTKGIYAIDSKEKREKALKWLKVEDVWGIGCKHAERL